MSEETEISCRICLESDFENGTDRELIRDFCQCKGSHSFIHKSCFRKYRYFNGIPRNSCEICRHPFKEQYDQNPDHGTRVYLISRLIRSPLISAMISLIIHTLIMIEQSIRMIYRTAVVLLMTSFMIGKLLAVIAAAYFAVRLLIYGTNNIFTIAHDILYFFSPPLVDSLDFTANCIVELFIPFRNY